MSMNDRPDGRLVNTDDGWVYMPNLTLQQILFLERNHAKDVKMLREDPSLDVVQSDWGNTRKGNRPMTESFQELKGINDELRFSHEATTAYADCTENRGSSVRSYLSERERLAEAWAEWDGKKLPSRPDTEAARKRLRDMAREDAKDRLVHEEIEVEGKVLARDVRVKTQYSDPLKTKMPRLTKRLAELLKSTGAFSYYYSGSDLEHHRLSTTRERNSYEEMEQFGFNAELAEIIGREDADLDYDMSFEGLEFFTDRDNYGFDRNMAMSTLASDQCIVMNFWRSYKPGTTLCAHIPGNHDVASILDIAEHVRAMRRTAPRVDRKIPIFLVIQDVKLVNKDWTMHWQKDSSGKLVRTNYYGEVDEFEIDDAMYSRLEDMARRGFYRQRIVDRVLDAAGDRVLYVNTGRSWSKRPMGQYAPQVIGKGRRDPTVLQRKPVEVRQDFCWKCANRAEEDGDYEHFLRCKKDCFAWKSKKNDVYYARTIFIRDSWDARGTQEKFCGPWYQYAEPLYGKSGEWKCLMCGTRKAMRWVDVVFSWLSRKGDRFEVTARVSGEQFLRYQKFMQIRINGFGRALDFTNTSPLGECNTQHIIEHGDYRLLLAIRPFVPNWKSPGTLLCEKIARERKKKRNKKS